MKYDVFLSHANNDKDDYVRELKQSFEKLGISVFYDETSIDWGDNWKEKIYEGLSSCKYGVIVLSKNFFDRKWTEKELKELLSRQNKTGNKIILPIAYEIDIKTVNEKYKGLRNIQFIEASKNDIKDITIKLAKILLSEYSTNDESREKSFKYKVIKNYCEEKMCSSLEFFKWVSSLIDKNDFINSYDDWIGWDICLYQDKKYPLFQIQNNKYRINPQYFDAFKEYYEKEIKPQM